ncbi:MAG: Unknown protein [uncultured Thiotrichaceae bacterium]|uniref:Cation transporter n=1 Tax=uncultured Thiotrichaceae bacterium TaxID=298394 RepID=A0A6S6SYV9_9GAMM|nr:MAG: Unknown protein [uncultured Thiotrichaceae bacterium]
MINSRTLRSSIPVIISLLGLWVLLSEGELSSWLVGFPFLLLAWAIWGQLRDNASPKLQGHLRLKGLVLFLLYFIVESVKGAWDVSRKVLTPRLSLTSTFYDYPIRLESPAARYFFMGSISLLPGTLSVDVKDQHIHIHILDNQGGALEGLKRLEHKIAALFGEEHDS